MDLDNKYSITPAKQPAQKSAPTKLCKHRYSCPENAVRGLVEWVGKGYLLKTVINLIYELVLKRGYKRPGNLIKQIFTLDALRFAGFIGGMNFLYKATLCLLRKIRGKDDGLNASIAGFVGGMAVLVDTRSRRESFALYSIARFLDIMLKIGANRGKVPDPIEFWRAGFLVSIIFMAYAYTCEIDTLLPSYAKWLKELYAASPAELKVMEEWRKDIQTRYPLK